MQPLMSLEDTWQYEPETSLGECLFTSSNLQFNQSHNL